MMKSRFGGVGLLFSFCALAACSQKPSNSHPVQKQAMANPASVYCVGQKGHIELKKESQGGVVGYCHLPDGKIVEEWQFFRQHHPKENKS